MKKLLLLLYFTSLFSYSQDRITFLGKIFDNLGELENVHIVNLNTQKATYTSPKGYFKLFAKVKDSIKITYVGYKTKVIVLKITDFGIAEKQIHLQKETIELDEVTIKKHNLLGTLSSDVKKIKYEKKVNAKTLKLPNAKNRKLTVPERRLYTAYGGGLLGIDYVINILSGRIKKLKKVKKIEENEKQITYLKNTFKNYIVQDLKIDSSNVSRFIYFCQENNDYKKINSKNKFAIIEYLRNKAVTFKQLNKKQ